jgi:hypothetical protein
MRGEGQVKLKKYIPTKVKPIKWTGTQKSAKRVLDRMPGGTVSWWGSAVGRPVELFLYTKRGLPIGQAQAGDWIGVDEKGNACIVDPPAKAKP